LMTGVITAVFSDVGTVPLAKEELTIVVIG
jgi:hypothetical protein